MENQRGQNKEMVEKLKEDITIERGKLEQARMERDGDCIGKGEEEVGDNRKRRGKGNENATKNKRSTYSSMKAEEERLSKLLVKANTLYKNKKSESEKEGKAVESLKEQLEKLYDLKLGKEAEARNSQSTTDEEIHAFNLKQSEMETLQEQINSLNNGGDGSTSVGVARKNQERGRGAVRCRVKSRWIDERKRSPPGPTG